MFIQRTARRPLQNLQAEHGKSESDEIKVACYSSFYRLRAYLLHHRIKVKREAVSADSVTPCEDGIGPLRERMLAECVRWRANYTSDVKAVKGRFTHHRVAACSFILSGFSDHPHDCCDTESCVSQVGLWSWTGCVAENDCGLLTLFPPPLEW